MKSEKVIVLFVTMCLMGAFVHAKSNVKIKIKKYIDMNE